MECKVLSLIICDQLGIRLIGNIVECKVPSPNAALLPTVRLIGNIVECKALYDIQPLGGGD